MPPDLVGGAVVDACRGVPADAAVAVIVVVPSEEFLAEPGDGPIKSFTLRGIKDSPPYLHDGRCLTLEDTVEFFNLVLELKLKDTEKSDLVAFMRCL